MYCIDVWKKSTVCTYTFTETTQSGMKCILHEFTPKVGLCIKKITTDQSLNMPMKRKFTLVIISTVCGYWTMILVCTTGILRTTFLVLIIIYVVNAWHTAC